MLGQAEVYQHGEDCTADKVGLQHDVVRLDVEVKQTLLVHQLHGASYGQEERQRLRLRQRTATDVLLQRLPVEVFHRIITRAVGVEPFVDLHDVGRLAVELHQPFGLRAEVFAALLHVALQRGRTEHACPVRVAIAPLHEVLLNGKKHGSCHAVFQLDLGHGLVRNAEAACAKHFKDFILPPGLACQHGASHRQGMLAQLRLLLLLFGSCHSVVLFQ